MSTSNKKHKYFPALDGIRGIAILMVLMHHALMFGKMRSDLLFEKRLHKLLFSGWLGVDLFFVLSGFLITGILIDLKGNKDYFKNFYMRRVLRIFPIYYVFLLLYFTLIPLFSYTVHDAILPFGEKLWYLLYGINIKYAFSGWAENVTIGHFWSLAVEEQFYLIWPLIIYLTPKKKLPLISFIIIGLSLTIRVILHYYNYKLANYVLMPARMDHS